MPLRSMTGFAQVKGEITSQAEGSAGPLPTGSSSVSSAMSSSVQGNGRLAFALALAVLAQYSLAYAGDWPERPIRAVVPFTEGSAVYRVSRGGSEYSAALSFDRNHR